MFRVLLDDHEGLLLFTAAAEDFARGDVPDCIFSAFMLATMTALQKREGGVRDALDLGQFDSGQRVYPS